MVRVVNWNINRQKKPWRERVRMADEGTADLALLQEAGSPPEDCRLEYDDGVFRDRGLYDRWPLVVKLSDRVAVEPFRQVAPVSVLAEDEIGVSGIGTIAAARVIPRDRPGEAFVAVSMYARWLRLHPSTKGSLAYSDASAHRILSDLSAFLGYPDPAKQRILAAGDLNMFYGAVGRKLSMPERERTVWNRMQALGLEFLGPQAPHGRSAPRAAGRCAAGHEEPADLLHSGGQAGNRAESTGLCVRVARIPPAGVRAGAERGCGVGTERPLPPADRGAERHRRLTGPYRTAARTVATDPGGLELPGDYRATTATTEPVRGPTGIRRRGCGRRW